MSFVLLFLVSGLPGLFGSLIIVQNHKQGLQTANEAIAGHTVGRDKLLGSRGTVLSDGLNKTQ